MQTGNQKKRVKGKEPLAPDVCPYCKLELKKYPFIDKPVHVSRCSEYFNDPNIKTILDNIQSCTNATYEDIISIFPSFNIDDPEISNLVANELTKEEDQKSLKERLKSTNKEVNFTDKKKNMSEELKEYYRKKGNQQFCDHCKEINPVVAFPCCKDVVCLICIRNRVTENFDKQAFFIKCNICKYFFNADEMGSIVKQVDDAQLTKIYYNKLNSCENYDWRDRPELKRIYSSSLKIDDVKSVTELFKSEYRRGNVIIKKKLEYLQKKFEKCRQIKGNGNGFYTSLIAGLFEQIHQFKIANHQGMNPKLPSLMRDLPAMLLSAYHDEDEEHVEVRRLYNVANNGSKNDCHEAFFEGDPYLKRLQHLCSHHDPAHVEQDCDEINELMCDTDFICTSISALRILTALFIRENSERLGINNPEQVCDHFIYSYKGSPTIDVIRSVSEMINTCFNVFKVESNSDFFECNSYGSKDIPLDEQIFLVNRNADYHFLIDTNPQISIEDFIDNFNTFSNDDNLISGYQLPISLLIAKKIDLFNKIDSGPCDLDSLIENSPFNSNSDHNYLVIEAINVLSSRKIIKYSENTNTVSKTKNTSNYDNQDILSQTEDMLKTIMSKK